MNGPIDSSQLGRWHDIHTPQDAIVRLELSSQHNASIHNCTLGLLGRTLSAWQVGRPRHITVPLSRSRVATGRVSDRYTATYKSVLERRSSQETRLHQQQSEGIAQELASHRDNLSTAEGDQPQ